MSYRLIIGSKNYSSWSMRAWLALRLAGAQFEELMIPIYTAGARNSVTEQGGETGLVPVLVDGPLAIWDTLAIFEYLAERYSQIWPVDASHRARARSYAAEIHSGFGALRAAMPCNVRGRRRQANISQSVEIDIARVIAIWETSGRFGTPWLFGDVSGVEMFFAPIATRFRTYGIDLAGRAAGYSSELLAQPLVAQWIAEAEQESTTIPALEIGRERQP